MKNKRKSPIQTPPLNLAGERLRIKFSWTTLRKVLLIFGALEFLLGFATKGILDSFGVPTAWMWAIWAIAFVPLSIYALFFLDAKKEIEKSNDWLGMKGELAVAEELAQLGRRDGEGRLLWREFHDVKLPEGGNADHVLVCEMGVYCLETKTLRRRGELDALVFDGDKVRFRNGGALTKWDPIRQARGNAAQLSAFLAANGMKIFVKPVVVFPGWAVERTPAGEPEKARILVCGEKELGRIESNRQKTPAGFLLSPEKIAAIGDILERANRRE